MAIIRLRRVNFLGLCFAALGIFSVLLAGCGGGGGSSTPPPAGDFTISTSPTSLTLENGQTQTVTVSVAAVNSFTSGVSITIGGLPTGVTAAPATFSLTPVGQQQVTLMAAATVTTGTASVTFQGTSGSLSHRSQVSLTLSNVPPGSATVTATHAPLRTRYLRTNSFYDPNSSQFAPPHFSVYDSAHHQFFVSNPYMNEIDVFSATSETKTAAISVPLAWGIDISPIDGSLYAGTFLGDVYHINTSTLSVMQRYPAGTIGPNGFSATTTLVLADGRLVLQGPAGGILGVDGFGVNVIWDPSTNAMDTGTSGIGSVCNGNGGIALDGTRTFVLVTTVDEGGGALPLCSYDSVTRVATYATYIPTEATLVRQIVPKPDGTKIFVTTNLDGIEVFEPKTLQQIGQIAPASSGNGLPDAAGGAVMSLDGKTLYLVDQQTGSIFGYDTTTYQQVSVVPHVSINDAQSWIVVSAIDETGLIIGPIGHGIGFADAAAPETTTALESVLMYEPTPNNGPISGDTAITDVYSSGASFSSTISNFYIGNSLISDATIANQMVSMITPAASVGMPVDLTALFNDGAVITAPEGFSYGPTILEVVPNAATADGGQQGAVIGYGFGNSASAIHVTIGGLSASVQNLYDYAPIRPYPFPVETLTFTIPPGVAGETTVSITSPSGTTTGHLPIHRRAFPTR